jgi:hypothetical protein
VPTPESVTCPRCDALLAEEYYGPCASCRSQLRALYQGEKRVADTVEYVPKMNVTPNAVALRDD